MSRDIIVNDLDSLQRKWDDCSKFLQQDIVQKDFPRLMAEIRQLRGRLEVARVVDIERLQDELETQKKWSAQLEKELAAASEVLDDATAEADAAASEADAAAETDDELGEDS